MATYYIQRSIGNNNNPGTEALPWQTIQKAANTMVAGDTVLIKDGNYPESVTISVSGTSGSPITYKAAPGHAPVLNFPGTGGISCQGTTTVPRSYIHFEGLFLDYQSIVTNVAGFTLYFADHITLRNCTIRNAGGIGVTGASWACTLDRCSFIHCGHGGTGAITTGYAIYTDGNNWTMTSNLFIDTYGWHIQISAHRWPDFAAPSALYRGFENNLIANNVFAYSGGPSGGNRAAIIWWSGGGPAGPGTGNIVRNNIFYQNGQSGTGGNGAFDNLSWPAGGTITCDHNIHYATAPRATTFSAALPLDTSNGGNRLLVNPNFVNAPATILATADFHLTAGSTEALDTGLNLFSASVPSGSQTLTALGCFQDRDAVDRPFSSVWEIGAYEFGAAPDVTAPDAPTGLTVE
jgi:hypothetical protein